MSDAAVIAVIEALEALGVAYMLVGSFSTNLYGVPRSTQDADFVVRLREKSLVTLAAQLAPRFRLDPQMSFESVTLTARHVLYYAETPFKVELFQLSSDAHDQARFARRKVQSMLGRNVYVPSVEDVIVSKLRWLLDQCRPKDKEDVENVIGVQRDKIDWDYVKSWCEQHGTRDLLEEIIRSTPPV